MVTKVTEDVTFLLFCPISSKKAAEWYCLFYCLTTVVTLSCVCMASTRHTHVIQKYHDI